MATTPISDWWSKTTANESPGVRAAIARKIDYCCSGRADDAVSSLDVVSAGRLIWVGGRYVVVKATTGVAAKAASKGGNSLRKLSSQQARSVLSLEKRIAEHKRKLEEFMNNPTVRPGMQGLPRELIEKQQAARIAHLRREIETFENNIDKILLEGYK